MAEMRRLDAVLQTRQTDTHAVLLLQLAPGAAVHIRSAMYFRESAPPPLLLQESQRTNQHTKAATHRCSRCRRRAVASCTLWPVLSLPLPPSPPNPFSNQLPPVVALHSRFTALSPACCAGVCVAGKKSTGGVGKDKCRAVHSSMISCDIMTI